MACKIFRKLCKSHKGRKNLIPNGGHLNAETGYTSFPKILEIINKAEV
jgi:predicted alpha/beta hydrolase family esterase